MNNVSYPVIIHSGNRITIPKPIFEHLEMKEGGFVILYQRENGIIVLTPAKVVPVNKTGGQ